MYDSLAGCWFLIVLWLPAGLDPSADELRQAGIEPTRQGVEKFLESLRLTPAREAKMRALLADLGSVRYAVREKATTELLGLPYVPHYLLREAAAKNLEMRRRVENIQTRSKFAECEGRSLLAARFIEERRLKGFAPLLLELLPQWEDQYLMQAASRAIAVSARKADIPALRGALAPDRPGPVRAAAVTGLAAVAGEGAEQPLTALLNDADSRVCLAAAAALLNRGNRKPLATLVRLLDAESLEVRGGAGNILQAVTGMQFGYVSYDEPKQRAEAVAGWRAWVQENGASAKLHLPILARPVIHGRLLIADYSKKTVREVDLITGKTIFEAPGFSYLWGCHATPEGYRLAVDWTGRFVVEFDRQGKESWRKSVPGDPTSVERLANGRTLIALADAGLVIELDRNGQIAWRLPISGRPSTAQRLANGNTLVNLQYAKKVVEVTPKGTVVWELTQGLRSPHTAQQLDNGNVLVADFGNPGSVTEFNRAGKVVWSKEGVNNPAQAQRLANGNTIISSDDGLIEYDPRGKVVRHLQMSRSKFFAY